MAGGVVQEFRKGGKSPGRHDVYRQRCDFFRSGGYHREVSDHQFSLHRPQKLRFTAICFDRYDVMLRHRNRDGYRRKTPARAEIGDPDRCFGNMIGQLQTVVDVPLPLIVFIHRRDEIDAGRPFTEQIEIIPQPRFT